MTYNGYRSCLTAEPKPDGALKTPEDVYGKVVRSLIKRDFDPTSPKRLRLEKEVEQGPYDLTIIVMQKIDPISEKAHGWSVLVDGATAADALYSKPDLHKEALTAELGDVFDFDWSSLSSHRYLS